MERKRGNKGEFKWLKTLIINKYVYKRYFLPEWGIAACPDSSGKNDKLMIINQLTQKIYFLETASPDSSGMGKC